ncbi:hypothetical protein BD560DRAFT_389684 [Blakeslea trispora]|nr:hypothetical protein BD560DRAFT_389684 [Blakeslea trispora]
MLTNKFANLDIKKSRVNGFMKNKCNLSMKRATFWSKALKRLKRESLRLHSYFLFSSFTT